MQSQSLYERVIPANAHKHALCCGNAVISCRNFWLQSLFRRHGQLLQNASVRFVQTLAFCSCNHKTCTSGPCSCNRKTCTSGSYPRMLISTRFAVGAMLYLVEI